MPDRGRLLMDNHRNDILLVEQIDRLIRLSSSGGIILKEQLNNTNCELSAWMFQHQGKPCQIKFLHNLIRLGGLRPFPLKVSHCLCNELNLFRKRCNFSIIFYYSF